MSSSDAPEVFDFRKPQKDSPAPARLTQSVFFVGFMGAGKTSVTRKLARRVGVPSIDMDTFIERAASRKISQIFAEEGEAAFRAMETDVLRTLAAGEPQLVSCGGGIVLAAENREILKTSGFVVYLQVTAAEAASRISNLSSRPLFRDLENAERVIKEREPLYEEVADVSVDTSGRGSSALAEIVGEILKEKGILWQPK